MIPINNSDTAWLIVADYNQENDIGFPDALREDILDPTQEIWWYESPTWEFTGDEVSWAFERVSTASHYSGGDLLFVGDNRITDSNVWGYGVGDNGCPDGGTPAAGKIGNGRVGCSLWSSSRVGGDVRMRENHLNEY